MSLIKTPQDIQKLRIAGKKLAAVLNLGREKAQPGISLLEIDTLLHKEIAAQNCRPSFLGFEGYPNATCLSVNEQVVHGIPSKRVLMEGDVLGIDVGLWYGKVCVDAAITVPVGKVSKEVENLLEQTQKALQAAIRAAKPSNRVGAISQAIQQVGDQGGFGIVRALTGHGVGHHVHEDPEVPNVGRSSDGILLRPGMVLAIEPMFTLGKGVVLTEVDGWGIITADNSIAAQFEHTIVITNTGCEVLTR